MQNNIPLVSIITPSYNNAKFITKTIESVINQTYSNWEMIIVDDSSTDNSIEVIQEFVMKEEKITLLINKKNIGAAETRNVAIRQAKGRFIAFLDSDDIWKSNKLEFQIQYMIQNNFAFTFTSYNLMNEKGELLFKNIKAPNSINYNEYLRNTIIGCLTVVIDKMKVGYFEMPIIKSSHDMALWLLIMKKGFIAYGIQENLATYRLVSNSNTSKKGKAALDVWKVYREIEKLNFLQSAFCFVSYIYFAILKRI